jgi:hypothetical protein
MPSSASMSQRVAIFGVQREHDALEGREETGAASSLTPISP